MKWEAATRLENIRTKCWAFVFTSLLIGLMATPYVVGCQGKAGQVSPEPDAGKPQGTVGVSVTRHSSAAPALGVVVNQNLEVIDVEAASVAEQVGIQRGDILKTVDNTTLASAADAARMIGQADPGQPMTIIFRRGGRDVTLQVVIAGRAAHPGQPTRTPVPPDKQYL